LIYKITPVPKPRQTRSDKWKKRKCVLNYRAFADEFRRLGMWINPGDAIYFTIPMPKSWSDNKKDEMNGNPHEQKPDLDNLIKAVFDSCCKDDSKIHGLGPTKKVWGYEGSIEIDALWYKQREK